MINFYKKLHVLTSIVLTIVLLIITFSTDNPLILMCVLIACGIVYINSGNFKRLKYNLFVFVPFSLVAIIINTIFVQEGQTILIYLGNRKITLEALIYALILSVKLLLVIYIFGILGIMLDSDRAVSYFSSKLPKSTLMIMITLKLFPNMKRRLVSLKEIYSIRGVVFEGKSISDKVKSYIPILSILLEDSLEGSFDIGESSYVRGFLGAKRSVYEKQTLGKMDLTIISTSLILVIAYLLFNFGISESGDFYSLNLNRLLFTKGITVIIFIFVILCSELMLIWRKLKG